MNKYANWINADSGLSFAEYLGIDTHCEWHGDGWRYVNSVKGLWGPTHKTKKEAKMAFKQLLKEGRTGHFL